MKGRIKVGVKAVGVKELVVMDLEKELGKTIFLLASCL
jgi:hypothetical protein